METKVYVKVIIKSEADLPKDNIYRQIYHDDIEGIDFYLLPKDLSTDEEIAKKFNLLKGFNPEYNEKMLFARKGAKWLRDKLLNNPLK